MTADGGASAVDVPAAPVNAANRFAHIDAMRALAVVIVLFQHSGLTFVPGDSGVVVFFTISGFIITSVLLRERERTGSFDVKRFYVRRLLKLGPPFVVAILLPTLVYACFRPVHWGAVASQVFFTYNWVQVFDGAASYEVLPGSNVVWSLAVEEQFYIAFALIWFGLLHTRRWHGALIALAVAAIAYSTVMRVVLCVRGDAEAHVLRGTDVRMDAIAWGVLTALAYRSWRAGGSRWLGTVSRDWVPVVAVVLFLAVSAVGSDQYEAIWRNAVIPLCSAAVIVYGLLPTGTRLQTAFHRFSCWKSVSFIGLASYSIYISHYVLLEPIVEVWDGPVVLRTVALTALGVAAGSLLYVVVERPVFAWRDRVGL
ncbi:acyltransferase family protein [Goekera deserti]|uniref:Acyltransferase n=1 Tax=Goekera deserti TaxID=2497753 RepID=A0A7K3WEZ5_9ACTN|nr:acyltransferase [Goekera deserti]NDI48556.1 acyltransferase family protein [Goekera deserti]NEL55065.1 acyltransferase [Goekera deserti]